MPRLNINEKYTERAYDVFLVLIQYLKLFLLQPSQLSIFYIINSYNISILFALLFWFTLVFTFYR